MDDAGVAEGVGSRYFRIQNGPALRAASVTPPSAPPVSTMLAQEACTAGSRTGHDPAAEWQPLKGKDGAFELATGAGRVQLRFCAPIRSAYLVQGGERRPLPVGASIDSAAGVFAWEPGPAFLGEFDFVFALDGAPASRARISLVPKPN